MEGEKKTFHFEGETLTTFLRLWREQVPLWTSPAPHRCTDRLTQTYRDTQTHTERHGILCARTPTRAQVVSWWKSKGEDTLLQHFLFSKPRFPHP